ncbi:hypothetical protein C8N36_11385 [Pelagimonas varians]|uniref:Lipoprotein n=1 Tax=Pelagimonas varians TaxID=696760 RepID=A0A238KXX6_9RHOB|nr:hypothetical protein C8N36_11385 [Pelagimonas varians]SMX46906.1 hypothetical protein PEV8663_03417 [Pelagimonas varians]
MVSSSKILTVSYGTFSCTAEGFEDPLAVMKDTTHFFRSVVGEDRFFGAEPPQFDPELASELMREQVTIPDGGQVRLDLPGAGAGVAASSGALAAALAAGPTRAKAEPKEHFALPDDDTIDATAYAPEIPDDAQAQDYLADGDLAIETPQTEDLDLDALLVEDADQTALMAEPVRDAPAPRPAGAASVAAKLDRIRAVVSETATDDNTSEKADADFDSNVLEALHKDIPTEDEAGLEDPLSETSEDDNLFADTIAGLMQADQGTGQEDTLSDVDKVLEAAFDENGEDFDLASALDQVDEIETAKEGAFAAWDADEDDTGEDNTEAAPADLSETVFDDEDDDGQFYDEADEPEAPVAVPVKARVIKVKRSDFDKAIAAGQLEEVAEEAPSDTPVAPLAATSSLSLEEEEELARELAAVKAELAGEMDNWDDDVEAATPASTVANDDDDWDWDEDQEDDLSDISPAPLRLDNPVAASDQDWTSKDDSQDDANLAAAIDGARKAIKMASPARAMLTEQSVEDNDTSRILDQTNTELEEPEGNRRRSAIAHLRAAVAATKADRLLGRKPVEEEEIEPYREDLANVVRPRRPQASPARTERPSVEPARSAPLKLVAEQRVADVADAAPVRPRRVNRTASDASPAARSVRPQENAAPAPIAPRSVDGNFAAYAESVGANELPELLEAAAAYMSYVEGLEQFSRPQLMTTVRQAEAKESSREDRLRSFGQLLREGKIEKTSGGRFTASERISFKPSRAAG